MTASIHNRHFLLRRLHSLFGVIPLGVFLILHLWENAQARLGAERFNAAVAALQQTNYLTVLEIVFIIVPLLFHAGYGLVIVGSGNSEPLRYPYVRNWLYWSQRISGIALIAFLALHVGLTRIAGLLDPEIYRDLFGYMQQSLTQPVTFTLYLVGLWLAVLHLANGLNTAAIVWGLTASAEAQRRFGYLCLALGLVLGLIGTQSLIGFLQ